MIMPSKEVVRSLIPEHTRPRTDRSALAETIGEEFLRHRSEDPTGFNSMVPLIFGVKLFDQGIDTFFEGGNAIECDPYKCGFIASVEVPDSVEDEELLKGLLLVGRCGIIPTTAEAYKNLPVKMHEGEFAVLHRTKLTDPDGLVWVEITSEENGRVLHRPRLMIFPQGSLVPGEVGAIS